MIRTRTLVILLVLAMVSTALAVWSWRATHAVLIEPGRGEPLLPALETRGKDAAEIEIVVDDGKERLKLVRKGDRWYAGPDLYPADNAKVRKLLLGLLKLRKAEPKTRLAKNYRTLDVETPGKEGAQGTRVIVRDGKGAVIADVILGKPAYDRLGAGKSGQYVRLTNDERVWLVEGLVRPVPAITRFVDHYAVDLPRDDVVRGRIRHKDGEVVEVRKLKRKSEGDEALFEIVNKPEGAKEKPNYQIASLARDMAQLDFELVRKAKTRKEPPLVQAEVETKDGLVVGYDVWREGEALWVQVHVLKEGKDKKRAEEIRKETAGWEYGLSESLGSYFLKRLSDLIEAEEKTVNDLPDAPAKEQSSAAGADAGTSGKGAAEAGKDATANQPGDTDR
ncbi:DUF4340 domain-containing protein [Thermopetrobacter sp. TC1]|uniref:DUF4340 domain-containing protein n=1 Tax=Thermopetrobacter sp. TC1 TaxID=1495045 RepID=UPI0006918F3B|nr:DUF4340 domain-containing protein [Thermopetrobacter sp. TC1]